jgi:hypothetical protein
MVVVMARRVMAEVTAVVVKVVVVAMATVGGVLWRWLVMSDSCLLVSDGWA